MQQYTAVCRTALLNTAVCRTRLLNAAVYSSMPHYIVECSSMPHLSRYHTLHVIVRRMRIWPPNAAKCCKNAGKFFPNVLLAALDRLGRSLAIRLRSYCLFLPLYSSIITIYIV